MTSISLKTSRVEHSRFVTDDFTNKKLRHSKLRACGEQFFIQTLINAVNAIKPILFLLSSLFCFYIELVLVSR